MKEWNIILSKTPLHYNKLRTLLHTSSCISNWISLVSQLHSPVGLLVNTNCAFYVNEVDDRLMTNKYKQYFAPSGVYFGLLFSTFFEASQSTAVHITAHWIGIKVSLIICVYNLRGLCFYIFFGKCFSQFWNLNYVDMHVYVDIKLYQYIDMEKTCQPYHYYWGALTNWDLALITSVHVTPMGTDWELALTNTYRSSASNYWFDDSKRFELMTIP